MPDNTIRGRFAPSPSGRLHLGNVLTFLLAWLDVRARGGTMVFRLEDLDPERSWEHYAELMADDLLWLGLDWDEGWRPGSQDSRQGTRTERYTAALDALTACGMVYDCYCSRAERLAASAPHPGEPREAGCPCRTLTVQEVQARLRMGRNAAKKLEVTDADISFIDGHYGPQKTELRRGRDDFLIRRSDGVFAYQLAVSVDDLEALRQKYTPEQLTGKLAKLAGLRPTDAPVTVAELAADFSWDKVPRADIPIPEDF